MPNGISSKSSERIEPCWLCGQDAVVTTAGGDERLTGSATYGFGVHGCEVICEACMKRIVTPDANDPSED